MVTQPAGNPNDRDDLGGELLRNRAVTDPYEPGSTLKPFTAVLALETGRYKPETGVDVRPGYLRVGRNTVRDVHNYGRINLAKVISKSSNVGISKIALSMPRDRLWGLFKNLGFGSPTGIEYPGEVGGVLSHHSSWSDFEYATHAFGYGISVTSLQLAQAYAVLAADGISRPLSLLRREAAPQGARVFSAATARKVRAMLEDAVSREGTGFQASVPGNRVAGKTGTVHKIVNGRYSPRHYYSLFAGMAPASRPRLALVVIIDDAKKGKYYGGQVAAPVFSAIMSGALSILNVTPDAIPSPRIEVALSPGASP
jgi:cell division protein FtsI (penicillin-binding protein 3)